MFLSFDDDENTRALFPVTSYLTAVARNLGPTAYETALNELNTEQRNQLNWEVSLMVSGEPDPFVDAFRMRRYMEN